MSVVKWVAGEMDLCDFRRNPRLAVRHSLLQIVEESTPCPHWQGLMHTLVSAPSATDMVPGQAVSRISKSHHPNRKQFGIEPADDLSGALFENP